MECLSDRDTFGNLSYRDIQKSEGDPVTANTDQTCQGYCFGERPATLTDVWTGQRYCPECAKSSWGVQTDPLSKGDIEGELREAIDPRGGDHQSRAIETIANLITYQQRRIADLEAAVAKLTKGDS